MEHPEILITSDRTMMSNYRGREFLGFFTTAPAIGMPERLWLRLFAPKVKVDRLGRPVQAPYGLRKIEAALLNAGFRAAVVDPDHLRIHLGHSRMLMIGHHDYFAMASPSIVWWALTGREPVNSRSFREFISRPEIKEAKRRGLKVIVGGPAAWQWMYKLDYWERLGIDTVVEGEAEKVIVDIAEKALSGGDIPRYVYIGPSDSPAVEEIPEIRAASINGFVEVMRGCPRRCKFCSVTLRPTRYYPLDKIEKELAVNEAAGIRDGVIHAEDVLLYGARGLIINPRALLKLHSLVKKYYRTFAWSHASLAGIKYAQEKFNMVSRITELVYDEHQQMIGVEVGIETGSPRLARLIMPAKASPYRPEEWPDVVEDAFAIMHEHNIVPAATFILGLPGETEEDVMATIDLIDRLRPYRSLIVPMFFVPMGALRGERGFLRMNLSEIHVEALRRAFWHTTRWSKDILSKFYLRGAVYAPLKLMLRMWIAYVEWQAKKLEKYVEPRPRHPKIKGIKQKLMKILVAR